MEGRLIEFGEFQTIAKNVLKRVCEFCEKNGLKYFLSYGKDNYKNSGGRYDKAFKKTGVICISSNDYSQGKNLYSGGNAV